MVLRKALHLVLAQGFVANTLTPSEKEEEWATLQDIRMGELEEEETSAISDYRATIYDLEWQADGLEVQRDAAIREMEDFKRDHDEMEKMVLGLQKKCKLTLAEKKRQDGLAALCIDNKATIKAERVKSLELSKQVTILQRQVKAGEASTDKFVKQVETLDGMINRLKMENDQYAQQAQHMSGYSPSPQMQMPMGKGKGFAKGQSPMGGGWSTFQMHPSPQDSAYDAYMGMGQSYPMHMQMNQYQYK